jgi:quinol monooxygenase YgiN
MTTILAHVLVKEGKEADFEALGRMLYAETHANEPRCRRYEYWRGNAPRTYYVLLSFDDFDGFMTHQVADYHDAAGPALGECFEAFRLEYLDPIEGASPLAPGQTSAPVPEGASDLWRGYVERHSEATPSWWASRRG